MILKSIIKIPLTIIFIVVLMYALWCAYIEFFDVFWIDFDEDYKVVTVFTWGHALEISLIIILSAGLGYLTYRYWIPKAKKNSLKPIRKPITIISGLVFVYDLFFIRALFDRFWPTAKTIEEIRGINPGATYPIMSYWIGTILILAILIAFQVGLGYLTYKAWFSKSHQPQTVQS